MLKRLLGFTSAARLKSAEQVIHENEEKQRSAISLGKSSNLKTWGSMADINQLVARLISNNLKRRDMIAKPLFKLPLRAEREPAYV